MKIRSLLFALLLAVPLLAQEVGNVNLSDLSPELAKKVKAELAVKDITAKVDKAGEWVAVGKAVGLATDGALSAISKNANEFANTKVGVLVMFIVVWKVIGYPILQFLVGIPLMFMGLIYIAWSYRKLCVPHRELVENTKAAGRKWTIVQPTVVGRDTPVRALHFGAAVAWATMCALISFAH